MKLHVAVEIKSLVNKNPLNPNAAEKIPSVIKKKSFPARFIKINNIRFGLNICADIWEEEPAKIAKKAGAEILLVLNASPYHMGKQNARHQLIRERIHENQFKEGHLPSSSEVDHIPQTDYAEILQSKGKENVAKYLGIFDKCAENSKFDMKNF